MTVTGSELIARALRLEGIETVFALAGDHTLPLMDRMARDGFRFIDTRHEQAAVDMANAYGRITGTPGVTMFTTPGHANAIPGLTLAHHMESPLVNISGCADQDRLGQGASQEIDQVGMAAPVTKGSWFVSDPYRIPEFIARAFRTALAGGRGPVHLTIPTDVQQAEVEEKDVRFYTPEEYRPAGRVQGDPARVRDAIDLLNRAKRPFVVVGNGAHSAEQADLKRLVEITGIPLFTEMAARGVVPDSHPLCFGLADGRANSVALSLKEADAVLLLGKKVDFLIAFGGPPAFDPDVSIIQVDSSYEQIGLSRGVDVGILGDPGAVVKQLADEAEGRDWAEHPMLEDLRSRQADLERDLEGRTAASGIHTMDVHKALRRVVGENDALVFEGCDFAFYGAPYHPSQKARRWFTNGTLGMIGWGVPFGIGAKVALPDSKVVVLTGDGSFGFNAMELDTAVRHNIPVVVVIGNDSVWGIDYHQQVQLFGNAVATELSPATRYDKMAEALGAHGEFVQSAAEIPAALERAFAADRPAVVNVRTEPSPSPLTEWIIEQKGRQGGVRRDS